jgi:hypothetical protein
MLTPEEESRGGVIVAKVKSNRLEVGRRVVENRYVNLSLVTF